MGYYSDDETEKQLKTLEKKIAKEYSLAYKEMKNRANEYFDKLEERYQQEYEAYKAGYYTKQEFDDWYLTQVQRGQGYEKMADDLAKRISSANQQASAYINDTTPSIYSLNYSYETYQIQMQENVNYHAYDEQTIKNLLMDTENVVEFKTTKVNPKRDYEWNRSKIQSAVTAGILQGKSIDKLADSFMTVMKRNRASAMRNARTSVTSAQNAGRQLGYNQANDMGIKLEKEWIATLDERTRISHGLLDGKRVPYDKRFSNGLMYPADSTGAPEEVYNCRCTMRAVLPNINDSSRMTYEEWKAEQETNQSDDAIANLVDFLQAKKNDVTYLNDFSELNVAKEFEAKLKNANPLVKTLLKSYYKYPKYGQMPEGKQVASYQVGNSVVMRFRSNADDLAHELMHWIDGEKHISEGSVKLIRADYDNLMKKAGGNLSEYLYSKHPEAFKKFGIEDGVELRMKLKYRGIPDIINGCSKGEISLGLSHSKKYWRKGNPDVRLSRESLAQFSRIYYNNDKEVIDLFAELFPKYNRHIAIKMRGFLDVE